MFHFSQAVNEPKYERGHTLDWLYSDQKIMGYVLPLLLSQSLLITSVLTVSCVLLFPLTLLCTENLATYVRYIELHS